MLKRFAAPAVLLSAAMLILWVLPSPCPIRFVLGVPCPSCGLTRAARAAVTFDFAEATRNHPLWFIVLPALALFVAIEVGSYVVRGRAVGLERVRGVRIGFGVIVGLLVCVWIARFFGAFGGPVAV